MNDLDKVKTLLSDLGVGFNVETECEDSQSKEWKATHPMHKQSITCIEGMDKVEGYCGFITEFYFDADGKFISMGIWE